MGQIKQVMQSKYLEVVTSAQEEQFKSIHIGFCQSYQTIQRMVQVKQTKPELFKNRGTTRKVGPKMSTRRFKSNDFASQSLKIRRGQPGSSHCLVQTQHKQVKIKPKQHVLPCSSQPYTRRALIYEQTHGGSVGQTHEWGKYVTLRAGFDFHTNDLMEFE